MAIFRIIKSILVIIFLVAFFYVIAVVCFGFLPMAKKSEYVHTFEKNISLVSTNTHNIPILISFYDEDICLGFPAAWLLGDGEYVLDWRQALLGKDLKEVYGLLNLEAVSLKNLPIKSNRDKKFYATIKSISPSTIEKIKKENEELNLDKWIVLRTFSSINPDSASLIHRLISPEDSFWISGRVFNGNIRELDWSYLVFVNEKDYINIFDYVIPSLTSLSPIRPVEEGNDYQATYILKGVPYLFSPSVWATELLNAGSIPAPLWTKFVYFVKWHLEKSKS